MKMAKRLFAILLTLIIIIATTGCQEWETVGVVDGTVISKEYVKPYKRTVMVRTGSITVPRTRRYHEKHKVTIEYKGLQTTVNSKELYNSVEIGNKVKVRHYRTGKKEKIVWEGMEE